MIDLERERLKVEALKKKILGGRSSPQLRVVRAEGRHPIDEVATEEDVGKLRSEERREGVMWEARSHRESVADQMATEAGQRRLEALEYELREEEDRKQQERARLRAEELKKRNQASESTRIEHTEAPAKSAPVLTAETVLPSQAESSQVYQEVLLLAYRDGLISKTEEEILALLRQRLGVTDKEHARLQQNARLEIYFQAMVEVWSAGVVTKQGFDKLDLLREQFSISAEDHVRLERLVRRQTLLRQAARAS
jgi:hypothetical protein